MLAVINALLYSYIKYYAEKYVGFYDYEVTVLTQHSSFPRTASLAKIWRNNFCKKVTQLKLFVII